MAKRYIVSNNCIIENTTGKTIKFYSKPPVELKILTGKLNSGSGFNGFTPTFILETTEEYYNVEKDRNS